MAPSDNSPAAKRAIRQRIGQLRRQLDRRIDAARRDTHRLISWEEWLRNRPWAALLAALGLGTAAAKGLRGAVESECPRPGFSPTRLGQMAATFWQAVRRWQDACSTPATAETPSPPPEARDIDGASDPSAADRASGSQGGGASPAKGDGDVAV